MKHKLKETIKLGLGKIKIAPAKIRAFLPQISLKTKDPLRDRLQRQSESAGN